MLKHPFRFCVAALFLLWASAAIARTDALAAATRTGSAAAVPEAMAMLRHAVSVKTVAGNHQVPALARYFADQLESAGFPASDIEIIPVGETAALVARYPGSGKGKPIYLSGHMDVVPAEAAGWADHDPFKVVEKDGWLYGRGVDDMKISDVVMIETLMRMKRAGFVPKHTIVLLLSGDEETEQATTAVLAKRFHDAEFLLNADAGGGVLDAQGKPVVFRLQAAEKTYADFLLTVSSPGGHSSEPDPGVNAMYRLAKALGHIGAYQFPVQQNAITRASLKATGEHGTGPVAQAMLQFAANPADAGAEAVISADPAVVGQIRTTCIATMMRAGTGRNVLPNLATANINCRIFPGTSVASVKATLTKVIDDPSVAVTVRKPAPVESPASHLLPNVLATITATVDAQYPGLDVVPVMSSGATDSMFFRRAGVLCYGLNFMFAKPGGNHAHGVDERIRVIDVPRALEFWHSLLTKLAG